MRRAPVLMLVLLVASSGAAAALPAHHPFAVGAGEGAVGHQNAVGAWLIARESAFYLALTGAVRTARAGMAGALGLAALSFAYGVFHAAGPGHGKAVITSYMVSNEVALRRGFAIALFAALFQGAVATALVGVAAFVFHATAPRMTAAAEVIELASYVAIVALGLMLCWRKGALLLAAAWPEPAPVLAFAAPSAMPPTMRGAGRFAADDGLHAPDCGCGGAHMPAPGRLGGARFDWHAATLAIVTAGARPCSGAVLVLVFALSQGLFAVGVAACFAMAFGTALTTGALAAAAVYAKGFAMRVAGGGLGGRRALVAGRLVEALAALCVLVFGLALLAAWLGGLHAAA